MSTALAPLLLLVVVAPLVLLGVLLVRLGRVGVAVDDAHHRLLVAQRILTLTRVLAVVAGCVALMTALATQRSRVQAAAACLAALVGLIALVMGEVTIRRTATGPAAGLEHRRVADYLPRWQLGVTAALALAVPVAAVVGIRLQDAGGSQLTFDCRTPEGWPAGGGGSWFGSYYWVPGLVVWVISLSVAAGGLRLVARRPRDGSDPDLVCADDELRRWSATGLVAGVGVASGGLVVPALLVYALRLSRANDGMCVTPPYEHGGQLALWGAVAAGLLTLVCFVRVLAPHRSPLVGRSRTIVR